MQLKKQSEIKRKSEARKKIMLGGLFVKAGLDHFHPHDPATPYGMQLYSKKVMAARPEIIAKWKELGKELMVKEKQEIYDSKKEKSESLLSLVTLYWASGR